MVPVNPPGSATAQLNVMLDSVRATNAAALATLAALEIQGSIDAGEASTVALYLGAVDAGVVTAKLAVNSDGLSDAEKAAKVSGILRSAAVVSPELQRALADPQASAAVQNLIASVLALIDTAASTAAQAQALAR